MNEFQIREVMRTEPQYGEHTGLVKAYQWEQKTVVHQPNGAKHIVQIGNVLMFSRDKKNKPWRVAVATQTEAEDLCR